MKLQRIAEQAARSRNPEHGPLPYALDTETMKLLPGTLAPPMVCTAIVDPNQKGALFHHEDKDGLLEERLRYLFSSQDLVLANAPYDIFVWARWRPELLPLMLGAVEDGRVHDVLLREKTMDIYLGRMSDDKILRKYSLDTVFKHHFREVMDKDVWRTDYDRLYNVPLEFWPQGAVGYAIGDTYSTQAVYAAQDQYGGNKTLRSHQVYNRKNDALQVCKAVSLHLTSMRGMKTDKALVDYLRTQAQEKYDSVKELCLRRGYLRPETCSARVEGPWRTRTREEALQVIQDLTQDSRPLTERLTRSNGRLKTWVAENAEASSGLWGLTPSHKKKLSEGGSEAQQAVEDQASKGSGVSLKKKSIQTHAAQTQDLDWATVATCLTPKSNKQLPDFLPLDSPYLLRGLELGFLLVDQEKPRLVGDFWKPQEHEVREILASDVDLTISKECVKVHLANTVGPENWEWSDSGKKRKAEAEKNNTLEDLYAEVRSTGKYISVGKGVTKVSDDPDLKAFTTLTTSSSMLSGAIKDLSKGYVLPIQTTYDPLKATGRTSSRNPNVQNQRTSLGVRECYVAREGYGLVLCDFDSYELFTLAQFIETEVYSGKRNSRLGDVLRQNRDPHCMLGATLARVRRDALLTEGYTSQADQTYPEASCEYEGFASLRKTLGSLSVLRKLGKAGNFGYPGGCSAATFTKQAAMWGVQISEDESIQVRDGWHSTWPEMSDFQSYIRALFRKDPNNPGQKVGALRQTGSNRWRTDRRYTALSNSTFQGLGADMAAAAKWLVAKETLDPTSPLYGSFLWVFVHDEIGIEAPLGKITQAAQRLQYLMKKAALEWCPNFKVGATYSCMTRWTKAVEDPRFTPTGELIIENPRTNPDGTLVFVDKPGGGRTLDIEPMVYRQGGLVRYEGSLVDSTGRPLSA